MVGQPLDVFGPPVAVDSLERVDDARMELTAPLLE